MFVVKHSLNGYVRHVGQHTKLIDFTYNLDFAKVYRTELRAKSDISLICVTYRPCCARAEDFSILPVKSTIQLV